MLAQSEKRCNNCGSLLIPGATNCTQCGAAADMLDPNASGMQHTLDSITASFGEQPTVSGQIPTADVLPPPSSQIRLSGVQLPPSGQIPAPVPYVPASASLPASRLPLIKIIIAQGIAIMLLLILVIASLEFSLPWVMKPTRSNSPATPTTPHVLYQADWANGLNGWAGSADWNVVNGQLTNNGSNSIHNLSMPTIEVPFDLSNIQDYAIEAKIQVTQTVNAPGFGFFVRYDNDGHGYIVGAGSPQDGPTSVFEITPADNWHGPLQTIDFTPGTTLHTYRIEVKNNHITVSIDGGGAVMDVTDSTYASGEFVGLWDSNAHLTISSFVIESV